MNKLGIATLAGLLLATPVVAQDSGGSGWTAQTSPFGTTVSNAEKNISFTAPNAEAGQKMADTLNKIDRKQDKKNK